MDCMTTEDLIAALAWAKEQERIAKDHRLYIEKTLQEKLEIPDSFVGSQSGECGDLKLTVTGKNTISVDTIKVIELAENIGKEHLINELFSVKMTLNKRAYDSTDEQTRKIFSDAITVKPAKINFKIEKKQNKP